MPSSISAFSRHKPLLIVIAGFRRPFIIHPRISIAGFLQLTSLFLCVVFGQVLSDYGTGIASGSGSLSRREDRLECIGGEDFNWDYKCQGVSDTLATFSLSWISA
ncbi:hypothetical protein FNV43_RR21592 [Rhamnella rubrinervis]|uniref:Uncharacterized protein n=1 Tax=Rhamnella rubrinervis TaxID=2594499 RepID=A0A8K0DNN9_9ROSA|nr:hypothetical protein FNV43_RR21592 [Rhamnella rubrinervis]